LYLRPATLVVVVARRPASACWCWWSPPPPELVVDDDSWHWQLPAACCFPAADDGDGDDNLAFPAATSLRHQSHVPEPAEAGAPSP